MNDEIDPANWNEIDGDVAGFKIGVYSQRYRLLGGAETTTLNLPSPGGTNSDREALILNESTEDWIVSHAGIDSHKAGEAAPDGLSVIIVPSGQLLRIISDGSTTVRYTLGASGEETVPGTSTLRVWKQQITNLDNSGAAANQQFEFTTGNAGDYRLRMSNVTNGNGNAFVRVYSCLLYTSDAADE